MDKGSILIVAGIQLIISYFFIDFSRYFFGLVGFLIFPLLVLYCFDWFMSEQLNIKRQNEKQKGGK